MATPAELRAQLEAAKQNPNVQKYLYALRSAEHGDARPDAQRYSTAFGGEHIADLSKYDASFIRDFKQTDGKMNKTSAQGAYQFIAPTWKGIQSQLGLTDFSPDSQDLGALLLMKQNGSLDDVEKGDFGDAMRKDRNTWASLPTSGAAQPKQPLQKFAGWLGVDMSKSPDQSPAGLRLNDGRLAVGATPAHEAKLQEIAQAPISDDHKARAVDVLAQIPDRTGQLDDKNLFGQQLPSILDKELKGLIERA